MSRPKPPSSDAYKILKVKLNATAQEIKNSYRRLCLQFHPDKAGPQSHEKFVKIQEAYEFLYDKAQKQEQRDKENSRRPPKEPRPPGKQDQKPPKPGSAPPRHWNDSDKTQPSEDDLLFIARHRATRDIDIIFKLLKQVEEHFETVRQKVEKHANKYETWVKDILEKLSGLIGEKKSEAEAASEQIKGVPDSEWMTKPEVRKAVDAISGMDYRIHRLEVKVNVMERTVRELRSVKDDKEKRLLQLNLLRIMQ